MFTKASKLVLVVVVMLMMCSTHLPQPTYAAPSRGNDDLLCAVPLYDVDDAPRYQLLSDSIESAEGALEPDDVVEYLGDVGPNVVVVIIDDFTTGGDASAGAHTRLVIDRTTDYTAQIVELDLVQTGYTTTAIAEALAATVTTEGLSNKAVIVLMSFVLVPCFDAETGFNHQDFIAANADEPTSLRSYIDRNLTNNPTAAPYSPAVDEVLLQLFAAGQAVTDDPLYLELIALQDANPAPVALVAPAGNEGVLSPDLPLLPAFWPEVIAVSAEPGQNLSGNVQFVANPGEVVESGGWYEFNLRQIFNHRISSGFAAALMSGRFALLITNGYTCSFETAHAVENLAAQDWVAQFCQLGTATEPIPTAGPSNNTAILDTALLPTNADITLDNFFEPDPYTITLDAGGPVNATSSGGPACLGFATAAADVQLNWQGSGTNLRFFFIGSGDTTLVINGPNGQWYCDDDSLGNLNPMLDFGNAPSGIYDIWVGTFGPNNTINGTLTITEYTGPSLSPTANAGGNAGGTVPDLSLAAQADISLNSGFLPDPTLRSVTAGGPLQGSSVGCFGSISAAPTVQLSFSGSTSNLRIWARSSSDTILAINTPSGQWVCDDDSGGNLNPLINFPNAASGVYDIYVGTLAGGTVPAEVGITELDILP